ncbi:MAG: hypothetical protein A3C50_03560 [Candidatus Staskawiczbacteria bacterium RIFCSPHIGHO2_02_FULL_43_16]|uniref:Glycosyl transferase family 1 domain-containing protein n=1 Tax=Candidatus Staskawiczbacteria bacterium RIFCSPHIGHO2_01_FULL_41_41 TaxID=1802203 RepID=A0A1G2HT36_9BACT|nr:MAG: hypothetical protein A2822_02665 [Candidatus Staskawiczbacteria bacterium RIFCSPHIGHO2_01_FULL_41_41]OGZ68015.1 MAG: hypothetical protein A3C50_03560 [Candidatus Staskawiczbacteria bacterium RIFCSPHIGHO2_02_FULL_43_16]OGZ74580.1 MAG: hypothetical protein A3A12_02360 [Candidatus Staskawiczbacteria bacterium RIFCSPLOWO2_01_FULL_43_17b]
MMRVGIFVYFMPEGKSGGVQQYAQQLIYALGNYSDVEVKVFCSADNKKLFEVYESSKVSLVVLSRRCKYLRFFVTNKYIRQSSLLSAVWDWLLKTKFYPWLLHTAGDYKRCIEKSVDVIHFPYQALDRYDFNIPTVISLHDLQHKIFPEFFTKEDIKKRDIYGKKSAELATRIMASFMHIKEDIVKFYGITPEKIDICGLGYDNESAIDTAEFPAIQKKYGIFGEYLIYPSVTWKHKNHINLVRALELLHKTYGRKITLVCTGSKNDFYPVIETEIKKLGLEKFVIWTGFIPETDLKILLKKSAAVIIPTLYEAESIPLIEAMALGAPVVCSSATVLPEQIGGDARFIFDPHKPEDMAEKINAMVTDEKLRQENIQNSAKQMGSLQWQKKIVNFVDSYKKAAKG